MNAADTSGTQIERKTTQVWGAKCDGVKSKNFPGSEKRLRVYTATKCKNLYALHFSVVNKHAIDGKVYSIATGYYDCMANLDFLS